MPYITSAGGFLQSVIYGYGGVRVLADRLHVRPQLIKGVTRMALRRIKYCGALIDLEVNATLATLTLVGGAALRMPDPFPTGAEAAVSCPAHAA